jgi:acyl-CoA thioesterase FadM
MVEWTETFRGVVAAWECDVVEHFTIAYYYEKLSDATRSLIELIGEGEVLRRAVNTGPSRLLTTFQHELRAGAAFHITSAVTGVTDKALRLGHQVIDTTSGKTVTWVAETLALPQGIAGEVRRKLESIVLAWPGPEIVPPTPLPAALGALAARDRVKPWEVDERGRLTLSDQVHRFSGAGMHFLSSVGMTSEYMHANRRGFSTFLLDIELISPASLGERIDVHTAAAHLGNTSLRYVHRMRGADGRAIATMVQAGVHLDLDARRPTPLPEVIRNAVAGELAKGK